MTLSAVRGWLQTSTQRAWYTKQIGADALQPFPIQFHESPSSREVLDNKIAYTIERLENPQNPLRILVFGSCRFLKFLRICLI